MEEGVGFEPTELFEGSPAFKAGAFDQYSLPTFLILDEGERFKLSNVFKASLAFRASAFDRTLPTLNIGLCGGAGRLYTCT
jgi:hypothetical protein